MLFPKDLFQAVARNDLKTCRAGIEDSHFSVDAKDDDGDPLLLVAVRYKSFERIGPVTSSIQGQR